jgi:hypothetical protein
MLPVTTIAIEFDDALPVDAAKSPDQRRDWMLPPKSQPTQQAAPEDNPVR